MAATARNRLSRFGVMIFTAMLSATVFARSAADASTSARQQVAAVAQALTDGDAAEAMTHFAKTYRDYDKLRRYFDGLAAFQIENQVDFSDEEDSDTAVVFTANWNLTITDVASDRTRNRSGQIHVKVVPVESKWRIVEFAPLDIFDPQLH